jgi:hypothetical protein
LRANPLRAIENLPDRRRPAGNVAGDRVRLLRIGLSIVADDVVDVGRIAIRRHRSATHSPAMY